jgi:hypothetical protein
MPMTFQELWDRWEREFRQHIGGSGGTITLEVGGLWLRDLKIERVLIVPEHWSVHLVRCLLTGRIIVEPPMED